MFFKHKKFISFLLILCTVFSMCSQFLTVFAVDGSGIENEIAETETIYDYPQAEILELDANDVPEQIDFNEAKEKGHVLRLREKEPDNNTVVFLNDDNTETMYIFAEPIKYTDESGEVKDKSRNLSLVDGKYTMTENDVLVNFPSKVSDGISASKGEYTVSMVPIPTISETITTDTTAVLANNKVIYSDVFGTADVLYTPLYSGFKEDIILGSYGGVNEFNFFVYTNGLIPIKNENGSVSFFDPDTAESVAEMMQVVCYDANNKFAGGDVVLTEIKENQIYGFTVIADAVFLSDENTAYPVSVDPTLSFSGTTAIEDAVVYSGKPTRNYANYNYNNIGYVDSSYKIGELLIKFPTLSSNSTFASLDVDDITSAVLTLYPASGGSGTEQIRAYQYNATWSESTITWNDLTFLSPPFALGTFAVPSNTAATSFNVTQSIKNWASSDHSYGTPDTGLFFMNNIESDPDECRDFLSTEYASSHSGTGMPRLEISYSVPTTVTVLLYDGDDDNNNVVQVEKGTVSQFEAYIVLNGIQHNAGTSLTYTSLDPTKAEIIATNSAEVRGVSVGSCSIRATYNGQPRAFADIPVAVWEIPVYFCDDKEAYDSGVYEPGDFEGLFEFNTHEDDSLNINLWVCDHGVLQAADSGITYTVKNYYGINLSNDTISFVTSSGRLSLNSNYDITASELNHPTGNVTIEAAYDGYKTTVKAIVKCEDYAAQTTMENCRFLKIDYEHSNSNQTLPTIFNNTNEFLKQFLINKYPSDYSNNVEDDYYNTVEANYTIQEDWLATSESQRFFDLIRASKNTIILTHGDEDGGFVVNANTDSAPGGDGQLCLTTADILSLPQGYFNQSELIILLCCYGGDIDASDDTWNSPTEMSLAEAFADRGAQRVIAFNDLLGKEEAKIFVDFFFGYLAFEEYDNIEFRPVGATPSCYNAMNFAIVETFGSIINTIETFTPPALDGKVINGLSYKDSSGNRVALLVGRGNFYEDYSTQTEQA